MSEQIVKEIADKILLSICEGKAELLELGQAFNHAAVQRKGQGAFMSQAYQNLDRIAESANRKMLPGMEYIFDAHDYFMLSQIDRLPWTKDERAQFFEAYYADDNRRYKVKI